MSEGGSSASLEVSFEHLWNATKDVATLVQNSQSVQMGGRAFACPNGVQPSQLDWADERQRILEYTLTWGSIATDWGISSGTSVKLGVAWNFGGTYQGRGRFLHEAYLYGLVEYSGLGQDFTVTGAFGDAYPRGEVGCLTGWIRVDQTYVGMHWSTTQFDIQIQGDGAGRISKL